MLWMSRTIRAGVRGQGSGGKYSSAGLVGTLRLNMAPKSPKKAEDSNQQF